jgi:3-phosphoshikimate 1-carboxyvinyltransferase
MKSYTPPADKSVTIRALLLAAAAEGSTRIENPLDCGDTRAAVRCLEGLGVRLFREGNAIIIEGRGLRGFARPSGPLDAGESAALARMLAGLLSFQSFPSVITGGGSLVKRPMAETAAALVKIGAKATAKNGRLPLAIRPAKLKGGKISGVKSAQVKTGLLLAGLGAAGPVSVKETYPLRDHTERLLALLGARITKAGPLTKLEPGPLTARPVTVPGDISSAAPFIAAALLAGEPLLVKGCGLNPLRLGFIEVLRRMGAKIELKPGGGFPEPGGDIVVRTSALKAARVKPAEIPSLIDEVPLLALLAAKAKGTTVIGGLEPLKAKESDRVAGTRALLAALGVRSAYRNGALSVTGPNKFTAKTEAVTAGDHRLAMAAAAASLACPGLRIDDADCVSKSYPGFWVDFRELFGRRGG